MEPDKASESVLGVTSGDRNWAIGFGAVAGGVVGGVAPLLWQWAERADLVPSTGVFAAIMSIDFTAISVVRPAVLALAGAVAMTIWAVTQPRVRVSDDAIVIEHKGSERIIRRDQVTGAYLDGSTLIIDSTDGRRLFEKDVEGAKKHAGTAFRDHGYPWESR